MDKKIQWIFTSERHGTAYVLPMTYHTFYFSTVYNLKTKKGNHSNIIVTNDKEEQEFSDTRICANAAYNLFLFIKISQRRTLCLFFGLAKNGMHFFSEKKEIKQENLLSSCYFSFFKYSGCCLAKLLSLFSKLKQWFTPLHSFQTFLDIPKFYRVLRYAVPQH